MLMGKPEAKQRLGARPLWSVPAPCFKACAADRRAGRLPCWLRACNMA
jgi:hypothetical protein